MLGLTSVYNIKCSVDKALLDFKSRPSRSSFVCQKHGKEVVTGKRFLTFDSTLLGSIPNLDRCVGWFKGKVRRDSPQTETLVRIRCCINNLTLIRVRGRTKYVILRGGGKA